MIEPPACRFEEPEDGWPACPACRSPNRPGREFCLRCAAPMDDAGVLVVGKAPAWALPLLAVLALQGVIAWVARRPTPEPAPPVPLSLALAASPPAAPGQGPSPADLHARGLRLLQEGRPEAAVPLLAEAAAAATDRPEYREAHAGALWASGEREAAASELALLARHSPGRGRWAALGRAQEALGQAADAEQSYAAELAASGDVPEARTALVRLLLARGSHDEVVAVLQRAAERRPDDMELAQDLGLALARTGDLAGAEAAYAGVLARVPEAALTRSHLAEVMLARGRVSEAVGLVHEGLALDPRSALLHRTLGSLLERAGRPHEAAGEYREYVRLAPEGPDAREVGQRAEALEGRQAADAVTGTAGQGSRNATLPWP